jgi:hypothetical protein
MAPCASVRAYSGATKELVASRANSIPSNAYVAGITGRDLLLVMLGSIETRI